MLFVGIDWASDHHDVVALAPGGEQLLKARVSHSAEGFAGLQEHLTKLGVPPGEIAVAVEMHEGPLVLWLLDQGYVVYGINPKTADRARDRISPTGAKDDNRDALSLADFTRTQIIRLRPLRAQDPATGLLRQYVRLREDLVQERTAHKQRLGAHLSQYAPELCQLLSPFRTEWGHQLLLQFPTMKRLQAAKPSQLRSLARKHRMASSSLESLLAIKEKPAIPVPDYLDGPHAFEVEHRIRAIEELDRSIEELDRKIDDLISNHPDANLIQSLPSGGPATRGALWSGLEHGFQMYRTADELAARWGAAPVTFQSGKSLSVRQRRACDQTQSQYLLWFSFATSRKKDCWASEYYQRKRAEGCGHYAALRCVARRWVRILWAVFTKKCRYDETAIRRAACAASIP
jgi:transposase